MFCGATQRPEEGKGSRGERGEVQLGAGSLRGARMGPGKEEAGRELAPVIAHASTRLFLLEWVCIGMNKGVLLAWHF